MRASLVPGAGVVLRTTTLLCVLDERCADLAARVASLDPAEPPGERPPAQVVEALTAELAAWGRPADIAMAVPGSDTIALYLAGAVYAETDGMRIVPEPAGPFDGVIGWPQEGLGLYLDGAVPDEPGEERFDLTAGIVPARGVLLHVPVGAGGVESWTDAIPAAPGADTHPSVLAGPPDPAPTEQRLPAPPAEFHDIVRARPVVRGIRCPRGHLNHPRAYVCAVCGIPMDQVTANPVEGERPPLGWLIFDNGATQLLDGDLVLGREPEPTDVRRTAGPAPMRIDDESGQTSRRHLEIRLVGWSVQAVDLGSANGTFVTPPHAGGREYRLVPHRPQPLVPGSRIRIGGRHFVFESPHPPS